jgi:hypothetical protein
MRRLPQKARQVLSGLLCAFLLFAQQAALAHVISHAPTTSTQQQQSFEQGGRHSGSVDFAGVCAFHAVFGQVLSAALGTQHAIVIDAAAAPLRLDLSGTCITADALTARSRGPPALL